MQSKVAKADEVRALGKSPEKLTIAQLKVLIAPLKRLGDRAIPSKKSELLLRLIECEARGPLSVEEQAEESTMADAEAAGREAAEQHEDSESEMDSHQMEVV